MTLSRCGFSGLVRLPSRSCGRGSLAEAHLLENVDSLVHDPVNEGRAVGSRGPLCVSVQPVRASHGNGTRTAVTHNLAMVRSRIWSLVRSWMSSTLKSGSRSSSIMNFSFRVISVWSFRKSQLCRDLEREREMPVDGRWNRNISFEGCR